MQSIIDTHLHTWDLNLHHYYWLNDDTSPLARNYLIAEVEPQLRNAGVSAAVLVQATNSLDESDWLLTLAARHHWIAGAVIWLPLADPTATAFALEKYKHNPFFKGVRHQIHDETDEQWLLRPNIMESLSLLAAKGIPYDLVGIHTGHIETAIRLAEKLPKLKMVFDHLNQPPIVSGERFGLWGTLMQEAALYPNLYVKLSGLGATSSKGTGWVSANIQPYVEHILALFSQKHLFCGSDWPVSLLTGTYAYTWNQYQQVVNNLLNDEGQQLIYKKNAVNFYQLNSIL